MSSKTSKRIAAAAFILFACFGACRSTKQNLNKPIESPPPTAPVSQSPFDVVDSKVIEVVSPFDHSRKEHRTKTQDCAACHLRPNNDPTPVWPGHAACQECHVKDLLSNLQSKMCVVCHKTPLD